ncbi:hypothetical protein HDU87_006083 [Geranomyces variabilis]|uniref:F-box domain-containing protein n=1 Tax=Geranomyces variabilis TaxID=109894 RepID=A0AAD5TG42_9FUNG|nr:hypothetical protein HDU87_006083 [Geranomyces variabilis]
MPSSAFLCALAAHPVVFLHALLPLDLPSLAALSCVCRLVHNLINNDSELRFRLHWALAQVSPGPSPLASVLNILPGPPRDRHAADPLPPASKDPLLASFGLNYRLAFPRAITAHDDTLGLLLARELALVAALPPASPLPRPHKDILLAIARCAFWHGLDRVTDVFLQDDALCTRITDACDPESANYFTPVPVGWTPPAPPQLGKQPWLRFRRAALARGHVALVTRIWTTRPAEEVWGRMEDTWIAELAEALRNPVHALHPAVTTMQAIWVLAERHDVSRLQSQLQSQQLNPLWLAAFAVGDLGLIDILHSHNVPLPPVHPHSYGFHHRPLAPWVVSSLDGYCDSVRDAISAHASGDPYYTDYWIAQDRALAWTDFFKFAATRDEFTGPDYYRTVVGRILACLAKCPAGLPAALLQCPINVLVVLLGRNLPDMICPAVIFEAVRNAPPEINVFEILIVPFWPPAVVASSVREAFDECARLAWDARTQQRWDSVNLGRDLGEQPAGARMNNTEIERRQNAVTRFVRDALAASLELNSPGSALLRKLMRKPPFEMLSMLDKHLGLRGFLSALLDTGETLRDDPTSFRRWIARCHRAYERVGWDATTATRCVRFFLQLGLDVAKIMPTFRPWCEHHGVPLALLAKHGSAWAAELVDGTDYDAILNPQRPPDGAKKSLFELGDGVLARRLLNRRPNTKPLDMAPDPDPARGDTETTPDPTPPRSPVPDYAEWFDQHRHELEKTG